MIRKRLLYAYDAKRLRLYQTLKRDRSADYVYCACGCGALITKGHNGSRKYATIACKQRAYRARHK